MLVAQVLSTNAFYRQVMQERGLEPESSKESERQNPPNNLSQNQRENNNYRSSTTETEETLIMLEKMLKALKTEIETIKKEL